MLRLLSGYVYVPVTDVHADTDSTNASSVLDETKVDENETDDTQQVINIFDRLCDAAEADSDDVETLPPHKHCGNHTLNLVGSCDSLRARDDRSYRRAYDRAMGKVQVLSKMNDIVDEITGSADSDNTQLLLAAAAAAISQWTLHEALSGSVKDFFTTVMPSYSMDAFRLHFCMTRHTFEAIISHLCICLFTYTVRQCLSFTFALIHQSHNV